nr:retroviral-like aspartic protease family protein [Massilia terrae]
MSALVAAAAAHADDAKPKCLYAQVAELPLNYTGTGLAVTTSGVINGAPAVMLVDTGAAGISLARPLVERLDLQMEMTGRYADGVGGQSRIYEARLDEFRVGPAKNAKGWFKVIADTGSAPQYDAIAGAPFLLQADLELSLAEKKMRFFRGKDCQKAFLGYWGGDIFEIPFNRRPEERDRRPRFTIEVNGQEMEAIMDSGAATTVIMASAAKRAGLKIDAPGSKRLGYSHGIGSDQVERWNTEIGTLKIGGETIRGARIDVAETAIDVDVLIGDDYLRAHRVLFAMGQQKLYISYLGGDPLLQRTSIEPWMLKEAESGNADAQYVVARYYGNGAPPDRAKADAWLQKAADAGQPEANLQLARQLMAAHRPADATVRLRQALDKLPGERFGALLLYTARLQTGEQDLGKRELQAAFGKDDRDQWPAPIADFYLGRIDAAALKKAATTDSSKAKARSCNAATYMAQLYEAQGEQDQASAAKGEARAQCGTPAKGI